MKDKYRIVEIKDGFSQKYYVEKRRRFLWIFPVWVRAINPNHKEWTGKDFGTIWQAREHIAKSQIQVIKTIH